MRIVGDNSHGFQNEKEIAQALNFKRFNDLNQNLKSFLSDIYKGYDLNDRLIHADTLRINGKPDFEIQVEGIDKRCCVSVKIGSGTSVHQEHIDSFCEYLHESNISEFMINKLKEYHFSDGTIDNSGEIRYSSVEYKKKYPELTNILNNAFDKRGFVKKVLKRTLFKGNIKNTLSADYIYYGTIHNGVWASRKEIEDYATSKFFRGNAVHFGPLTYQAWNKNLSKNPNNEHKRMQMQFKWGNLEADLLEITSRRVDYNRSHSYSGDMSERANVISFNKNPHSQLYKNYIDGIGIDPRLVLLVRVSTKQPSSLSNQRVNTRADAYAIKVLNEDLFKLLEDNDYYFDEDILKDYSAYFSKIDGSGISIKKDDSHSYSLIKLTPNSFNALFGSYELGYGASVFCERSEELLKNLKLMDGWNTSEAKLKSYFDEFDVSLESLISSTDYCKNLKRYAESIIRAKIDNDKELQKIIFNGKNIYSEPYSAFFFMQNNKLERLEYIPFNVTTGSGRSRGDYSIVLKPCAS